MTSLRIAWVPAEVRKAVERLETRLELVALTGVEDLLQPQVQVPAREGRGAARAEAHAKAFASPRHGPNLSEIRARIRAEAGRILA